MCRTGCLIVALIVAVVHYLANAGFVCWLTGQGTTLDFILALISRQLLILMWLLSWAEYSNAPITFAWVQFCVVYLVMGI